MMQTLQTLPILLVEAVESIGRWLLRLRWFFRKWFWIVLAWFKAVVNKPMTIPLLPARSGLIVPVPLSQVLPVLKIHRVLVCPPAQIPVDERSLTKTLFYRLQVWLYAHYSPMLPGLPSIEADPDAALAQAYTWLHRRVLGDPVLPAEYLGAPDLGALAVRGPYACYTQRCDDTAGFEWDLSALAGYAHHPGLRRLGVRVHFEVLPTQRTLRATRIDCSAGSIAPEDGSWDLACRLALCSATTHLSLVRHYAGVHLCAGAHLEIATRNRLPADHPLTRLLWPYVYATQQSNDTVTRGQLLPGGDFEDCYSFSMDGLCQLFDDSWGRHDFGINDPQADARARGVIGQGFDTPTEDNLARLFGLMLAHARHYLALYYPHAGSSPDGPESLRNDAPLGAWLDELNLLVPGGVGVTSADVDLDSLARLVARCIYLASVQHEIAGGFLWNYQLWVHRQPVRVYASGQREPWDIYQRLVNANYNLNVHRRGLIDDFSHLALDDLGAAAMQRFCQDLQALQTEMEREPWAVWKLYPRVLKVNINA